MDRTSPPRKKMMLILGGAVALGVAGIYYTRAKSGLSPEAATRNDPRANDKKSDANFTTQHTSTLGDVREKAK